MDTKYNKETVSSEGILYFYPPIREHISSVISEERGKVNAESEHGGATSFSLRAAL